MTSISAVEWRGILIVSFIGPDSPLADLRHLKRMPVHADWVLVAAGVGHDQTRPLAYGDSGVVAGD